MHTWEAVCRTTITSLLGKQYMVSVLFTSLFGLELIKITCRFFGGDKLLVF